MNARDDDRFSGRRLVEKRCLRRCDTRRPRSSLNQVALDAIDYVRSRDDLEPLAAAIGALAKETA